MKSVRLVMGVAMAACVVWSGCATGANKQAPEPKESKVMYTPPLEDKLVDIPAGPPVLPEYARSQPAKAPTIDPRAKVEDDGTISRAQLDTLLAQGPAWGLAQIDVYPVRDGSALRGYAVRRFSQLATQTVANHLQVGDIITHLNGVKIERPEDYMKAWEQARTVEALRIDYLRGETAQYAAWDVVD